MHKNFKKLAAPSICAQTQNDEPSYPLTMVSAKVNPVYCFQQGKKEHLQRIYFRVGCKTTFSQPFNYRGPGGGGGRVGIYPLLEYEVTLYLMAIIII